MHIIGPCLIVNPVQQSLTQRYVLALFHINNAGILQTMYQSTTLSAHGLKTLESDENRVNINQIDKKMTVFDPSMVSPKQAIYCLVLLPGKSLVRFRFDFALGERFQDGHWTPCRPIHGENVGELIHVRSAAFGVTQNDLTATETLLDAIAAPSSLTIRAHIHREFVTWKATLTSHLTTEEQLWLNERENIDLANMPDTFGGVPLVLSLDQKQCILQNGFQLEWESLKSATTNMNDYVLALFVILNMSLEKAQKVIRMPVISTENDDLVMEPITSYSKMIVASDGTLIELMPDYLSDLILKLHRFFLINQLNTLPISWMTRGVLPTFINVQLWMLAAIFHELKTYQLIVNNTLVNTLCDKPFHIHTHTLATYKFGTIKRENTADSLDPNAIIIYDLLIAKENDSLTLTPLSWVALQNIVVVLEGLRSGQEPFWQVLDDLEVLLQVVGFSMMSLTDDLSDLLNETHDAILGKVAAIENKQQLSALCAELQNKGLERSLGSILNYLPIAQLQNILNGEGSHTLLMSLTQRVRTSLINRIIPGLKNNSKAFSIIETPENLDEFFKQANQENSSLCQDLIEVMVREYVDSNAGLLLTTSKPFPT